MVNQLITALLPFRAWAQPHAVRAPRSITQAEVQSLYSRPDSFTDLLPWVEYDPESQVFLLEDGVSVGALFEIIPVGTEAMAPDVLARVRDNLQSVLTDAIPEEDGTPWVLQLYVQDEPSLDALARQVRDHINPRARNTDFTHDYLERLTAHLARVSAPSGLFHDTAVTGSLWRGQVRRIRAVLYRRLQHDPRFSELASKDVLNNVCVKFVSALVAAGFQARRCGGKDFYEWMLRWFNPAPAITDGDTERLLAAAPYPGDEDLPFGRDFAELLTLSMPRSDASTASWWFDGLPHKFVTVQALRRAPAIGHMTAERSAGDNVYALFDRLPEHAVMVMTLIIKPQDAVRNHVAAVKRASVGDGAEAVIARADAEAAELEMARGNKLYPLAMGFYVRGRNAAELRANVNRLNALLVSNGLQPITEEADLLALDSYVRNLPMAYDASLDRVSRRSRLAFARHTASLLPLYGRTRGSDHPGLVFFNRGAEPLVFDPLHPDDRKKNGHMLILGPTGAGKSATLVYLLMQMAAVYRPRMFIIEAGNSFELLGRHFAAHGVTVNQVSLHPGADVSLPPFSDAIKLAGHRPAATPEEAELDDDDDEADDERRDLLGEMEIAARIMITGGDVREDARMTRADRLLIRHAILNAAGDVRAGGRDQVLTRDVVGTLRGLAAKAVLPEHRRHRAIEMADGMELFCSGLAGHFFDRPGVRWPDTDVTIVDVGVLAREGYEDQLTVAYVGLMNHINDLVERHQHDARPTLVVTDEGHIITTNPLLAPYVVKITKMWRKLGTWFWIATQNLEDFPDQAKKMLNMMEWWLCLVMPKEEVEQIARFKDLTTDQRTLLLSARKEPGKYTEGVVLADKVQALFRNVPPPLALALAMTEKHEKAERARIMRERGCSELEAVYAIAEELAKEKQ